MTEIKKHLKKEKMIRRYAKERGEGPSQPIRSHRLRGILKKTGVRQMRIINIEDEETPTARSPEYQYEEDLDEEAPEINPAQQKIYNYVETLEKRASESRDRTPSPPKSAIDVLGRDKYELEVLNMHIKNLRFKLVTKKPRRPLTIRKSRRRSLDVLAEVSEYMS